MRILAGKQNPPRYLIRRLRLPRFLNAALDFPPTSLPSFDFNEESAQARLQNRSSSARTNRSSSCFNGMSCVRTRC